MFSRLLTSVTHKIYSLPVIVLMPHSSCNCQCVMCDIWKANHQKREISIEDLQAHMPSLQKLKVKEVVLSGGEALLHSNLWKFCGLLNKAGIKVSLLTTGLLLKKHEYDVARHIDQVIVSLDGSREIHNQVRGVPRAYEKLEEGIRGVRALDPVKRITSRTVLQRYNYFDFSGIINSARLLGIDQVSFLAADVSSTAFNRPQPWDGERSAEVALNAQETQDFEKIIESSFDSFSTEYEAGFIAERPEKMRKLVQYYKALNGMGNYPDPICNAPWVSSVVESDGNLLPCFFHKPYGNINGKKLEDVLNSPEAIQFRKNLQVSKDPICQKCVCTLKMGLLAIN